MTIRELGEKLKKIERSSNVGHLNVGDTQIDALIAVAEAAHVASALAALRPGDLEGDDGE